MKVAGGEVVALVRGPGPAVGAWSPACARGQVAQALRAQLSSRQRQEPPPWRACGWLRGLLPRVGGGRQGQQCAPTNPSGDSPGSELLGSPPPRHLCSYAEREGDVLEATAQGWEGKAQDGNLSPPSPKRGPHPGAIGGATGARPSAGSTSPGRAEAPPKGAGGAGA